MRKPLSILLGLEGMALGGCPINALDLGRTLRSRGHRVSVFAIDEEVKVSLLPYAQANGFSPLVLPATGGIVSRARQIRALSRRVEADVVHVFGPWLGPAASVAAALGDHQAAIVTNWTMANVYFTPTSTPIMVGTRAMKDDLESKSRGPVWLMEPPVDVDADAPDAERGRRFRQELSLDERHRVAVLVSRVDSHMKAESMRYAIEACARLADPMFRLVIVGDGDAFHEMESRSKDVNDRLGWRGVRLTGVISDPRAAYDAADVALAMGGSALRALAHGRPLIVLGENGFARSFLPDTKDYFYDVGFFGDEPQRDPVGHLSGEILRMLERTDRVALGEFGRREVCERFSLQSMADRLEEVYHHTLEGLPAAPTRLTNAAYVTSRTLAHQTRRALFAHG